VGALPTTPRRRPTVPRAQFRKFKRLTYLTLAAVAMVFTVTLF